MPQSKAIAAEANEISMFSLDAVTVTDDYCENAIAKEYDYLASFDVNKLLAGFRENAGLSMQGATRYAGWENSLIGGHCVGHYLTALAQCYQNQSLTIAQKTELYGKMTALVDGLLECQKSSRGKTGFLWGATIPNSSNVEQQFDNVESGKTNIITEAWVPWYTMHKIIAGLNDVYNLTGYANAKTIAAGLGDWTYNRTSGWSTATHSRVLGIEYGGMNDCLYDLYAITGNPNHATAAHAFDDDALFQRISAGGTNALTNQHTNTTIPKFLGALKRYIVMDGKTVNGTTVDADAYLQYAADFWSMVTTRHTYVTGGCSEWEHFGEDDVLDAERTNCNCETCIAYNMMKMSRALYAITGEKKYMDYYENTYYNSMLSSQNPETGMTTYFQPMATGYFKVYSTPFTNFWCCTGSGMESFTKLGDTIYMQQNGILYVNLYQSADIHWAANSMTISQVSDIPNSDTAKFTITGSGAATFRFRIPDWVIGTPVITVNGSKYTYTTVNGYAQVSGDFKSGDVITVKLPMQVVAHCLPDAANCYAFKYGPLVLSAELGTASLTQSTTGMSVSIPKEAVVANETLTISDAAESVASFMFNINDYLKKDADSLKFTLTGTDTSLTFTPQYQQYRQRYGIYFYYASRNESTDVVLPRAKTVVTDTVQPGYGQYENDDLHQMRDNHSVGVTSDSTYRYAEAGGSFAYTMALDDTAAYTVLQVFFRKEDNGKSIQIAVGDSILYSRTLAYTGDADTYEVRILIPETLIARCAYTLQANGTDYTAVDVTFRGIDGTQPSARVCDFIRMQAVTPVYAIDTDVAYYVNCGDHDTTTATDGRNFGRYNSVTEQVYGADTVSGYAWGILDDATD